MKSVKQYLILLFALILCLAVLAACDEAPATDTTASEEGTTAAPVTDTPTEIPTDPPKEEPTDAPTEAPAEPETEPQPTELVIDTEHKGRILVAYYKDNAPASDSVYKSAESFRKLIQGKTELTVRVTRVRETSDNHAVTFLIGETPYEETAAVKASLPENSYAVQIMGRKIIIIGSDDTLTVKALKEFCDRVLNNPERATAGKLTILPEDSFTVTLDKPYTITDMVADGLTPTADYTEILHTPKQGQYSISQGAASDGTLRLHRPPQFRRFGSSHRQAPPG